MDRKRLTAEEERQKQIDETTDIITAEDVAEQAVYAVHAPDCCADERPENMLAMLGANVVDEAIYHDEDACPKQSM